MSNRLSFLKPPRSHRVPPDTIDLVAGKVGKFSEYPLCEVLASRDFTTPTDIATLRVEGGTYLAKACMNFSQGTFSRRIVFPLFDPGEQYAENVSELEEDFPQHYECVRALIDATYKGSIDYLVASNIVKSEDVHDTILFNRFAAGNNAFGKERCPDGSVKPFAHFHDFLRHKMDFHLLCCDPSDESTWKLVQGPPPPPREGVSYYFNDHLFGGPMSFEPSPIPDIVMRFFSKNIATYSVVYLEEAVRILNRSRATRNLPEIIFETFKGDRLRTCVPPMMTESTCRIVVCRHGQTEWNRQNKYQGHIDIPMNTTGISEARELRFRLNPFFFNKIVSSDLQRASSTTKIISAGRDVPILINKSIREKAAGETLDHFKNRILSEVTSLAMNNPQQSLLLSAHGGVLKMLIVNAIGDNSYTINNCAHLVFDFIDGKLQLVGGHGVWTGGIDTCGQSDWNTVKSSKV